MNFKDQIKHDLKEVFHNVDEFAQMMHIRYDGIDYEAPVIIDEDVQDDRDITSADHADGIFLCDAIACINSEDLPVIPRKGHQIEIGVDEYRIVKVSYEDGEIVLYLQMFDE